jgi:hypothetical protein
VLNLLSIARTLPQISDLATLHSFEQNKQKWFQYPSFILFSFLEREREREKEGKRRNINRGWCTSLTKNGEDGNLL